MRNPDRIKLGLSSLLVILTLMWVTQSAIAKDFGTYGALFPIHEQDVLELITSGFENLEATGQLDDIKRESQELVRERVDRPKGQILPRAETARSFTVDLSVTVERDLADHRGQVFARAGTHINPLEYSRFSKRIIMIDGDDPEQVAFALQSGNELDTLIVLTNGPSLALMREHGRRFWFDADSQMATKFQIAVVPSVITRADPVMRVDEIALKGDR